MLKMCCTNFIHTSLEGYSIFVSQVHEYNAHSEELIATIKPLKPAYWITLNLP